MVIPRLEAMREPSLPTCWLSSLESIRRKPCSFDMEQVENSTP